MKVHSKMMVSSSPGRPEKLVAPQFTKLLRGKGGSLSRGRSLSQSRSRSSPIFVTRRRSRNGSSSAMEIPDGKDPASPKVTCMGQVRITKKKKKKKKKMVKKLGTSAPPSSCCYFFVSSKKQERKRENQQCCRCLNGSALFWNPFSSRRSTVTPPPSSPARLKRWISSSCWWSYQKPMQEEEDPGSGDLVISLDRFGPVTGGGNERVKEPENAEEEKPVTTAAAVEDKEAFVPPTPPKNALLLMRCRSAPHRSSHLPTAISAQEKSDPIGEVNGKTKVTDSRNAATDGDKENDDITSKNRAVVDVPSFDESLRSEDEDDETMSMAAVGPTPSFSSRPLILTRCKSEPAKKTARLPGTETNGSCFWAISGNTAHSSSWKNKSTPID